MKTLLFFLILQFSFLPIQANNTSVMIEIKQSKVANLYYQVLENGIPIKEDTTFLIVDEAGNVIANIKTQDSILWYENIPFGNYNLVPINQNRRFGIKINDDYLQTQHIVKPLEMGIKATQTSDQHHIFLYLILFLISSSFLIYRKEDSYETI